MPQYVNVSLIVCLLSAVPLHHDHVNDGKNRYTLADYALHVGSTKSTVRAPKVSNFSPKLKVNEFVNKLHLGTHAVNFSPVPLNNNSLVHIFILESQSSEKRSFHPIYYLS